MRRLVLGSGEAATDVAEAAQGRPGETQVRSDDEGHVEALREAGVNATFADPAEPSSYPEDIDLVVIAADDPAETRRIAVAVEEMFPNTTVVAFAAAGMTRSGYDRLSEIADRVIDTERELLDHVHEVTTTAAAQRLGGLLTTLRGVTEPLLVVPHDNPDPDAIAAAMALVDIAERVGVEAEAGFNGQISHQENRALVNLLDVKLRNLADVDVTEEYGSIALVDHSVPGVNDSLPERVAPEIVIDHHPPTDAVDAAFRDIRPELGATATMLTQYVDTMGVSIDERIATALLYGIRIDTRDFTRGVTNADFDAAATLLPHADESVLDRVESPSISASVFGVLAAAIDRRIVRGSTVTSCVGELSDRDALPQAADQLLSLKGVTVAVVYGYIDDTVYVSARARGADVDLGETLRDAFGEIGSAGGHADMAGAQLELGILAETDSDEQLRIVLEQVVSERVFETLTDTPGGRTPEHDWFPMVETEGTGS
jgi:nanoRNase/pAp phosphatase (c-di-AMP/oligoRNAs hydrolase)